ncbi:MAG: DUF4402 domain-containing protein [bacterium]|nr:DUF4402 domain-containing protein [bacterium]
MFIKYTVLVSLLLFSTINLYAGPNAIQITPAGNTSSGQIGQGTLISTYTQNIVSGIVNLKTGDGVPVTGTSFAGQYQITAVPDSQVRTQIYGDATLSGPGVDITIDKYKRNNGSVQVDSTGILIINNAANFTIAASQTQGTYSGTYYIRSKYLDPIPLGENNNWVLSTTQIISVEIVSPGTIGIEERQELLFGIIGVDPAGGTVRLRNSGMDNISGISEFSGLSQPGKFRISGTPGATVHITTSTGDTLSGPGTDIQLTNFTGFASPETLDTIDGQLNINVRARLTFGPNQVPGHYSGTYIINVNY